MFKRISEIFKPKKAESRSTTILTHDLITWLDTEEKECIARRSEYISRSRATISSARKDILQLLVDFGVDENEHALHPKVEQVNRHNLPQFKRKIEIALDVSFSDDDETYYRQVAEMIDGCFKAYRGPGRYLHHLYGDEVKLFRQSMDQIGKELNNLTDAVKKSRERLGRIEAIRNALETLQGVKKELATVSHHRDEFSQKKAEYSAKIEELTIQRDLISQSPEYTGYISRVSALEEKQKMVAERYETLDSLVRAGLPVWRKVLRAVQDEQKKDDEKIVDHLIRLAGSQNYAEPEFISDIHLTSPIIFRYLDNEVVPLKNSFEKNLFCSPNGYVQQFMKAITEWADFEKSISDEKNTLASNPTLAQLKSLDEQIEDILRDVRHLDEEDLKNQGRINHSEREKGIAAGIIVDEIHELTGGKVNIGDLDETSVS
jgi:hypothetical protein